MKSYCTSSAVWDSPGSHLLHPATKICHLKHTIQKTKKIPQPPIRQADWQTVTCLDQIWLFNDLCWIEAMACHIPWLSRFCVNWNFRGQNFRFLAFKLFQHKYHIRIFRTHIGLFLANCRWIYSWPCRMKSKEAYQLKFFTEFKVQKNA